MQFAASTAIDVSPGWPDVGEFVVKAFSPKRPLGRPSGEFLNVRVYPEIGESWFAELEIGTKGDKHSEVCTSGVKESCFILAGGQAYLLNAKTRDVLPLEWYPVSQLVPDSYRVSVWLVGFWYITCVSPNGEFIWKSDRLASDDLRVLEIRENSFDYEGSLNGGVVRRTCLLIEGRPAS
jgi:hypothetical protein